MNWLQGLFFPTLVDRHKVLGIIYDAREDVKSRRLSGSELTRRIQDALKLDVRDSWKHLNFLLASDLIILTSDQVGFQRLELTQIGERHYLSGTYLRERSDLIFNRATNIVLTACNVILAFAVFKSNSNDNDKIVSERLLNINKALLKIETTIKAIEPKSHVDSVFCQCSVVPLNKKAR